MNDFIIGTCVGMIQTIVGHPLDTMKTNYQNNIKKIKLRNIYNGLRYPMISSVFVNGILFHSHGKLDSYFNNSYESGFVTGFICSPIINMFEVSKVQLQIDKTAKLNINNLSLGLNATILRESIGTSLYFGTYFALKEHKINPFICGGIAGAFSWLVTYPIDVIKTRIQSKNYTSYSSAFKRGNLSSGLSICILRSIIVNGISFGVFDYLKN